MQKNDSDESYPIDEKALKEFLIEKEKTDDKLWADIQVKAQGNEQDRKAAIVLIFENYKKVPREADSLLVDFASQRQTVYVRKILAEQALRNKMRVPVSVYFDIIDQLREDSEPEIQTIVLPEFKNWLEPAFKLADIIRDAFKKIEVLKQKQIWKEFEYNWLAFLPFDQMLTLLGMHKQGKDEDIRNMLVKVARNQSFFKNFQNELSSIPILAARLRILEDSMKAHIEGKFTLSVPCLLAQIEGALWDIAIKNGFASGTTIFTTCGKTEKNVKSVWHLVKKTGMYDLMENELAEFFLGKVYTKKFRHAILHGRNPDYAKEEDSMKMILLLRAIAEIAKNCGT